MAHKDLDLDALGSCVGLSLILKQKRKDCYIIVDDKQHELGVEKILKELDGCIPISYYIILSVVCKMKKEFTNEPFI